MSLKIMVKRMLYCSISLSLFLIQCELTSGEDFQLPGWLLLFSLPLFLAIFLLGNKIFFTRPLSSRTMIALFPTNKERVLEPVLFRTFWFLVLARKAAHISTLDQNLCNQGWVIDVSMLDIVMFVCLCSHRYALLLLQTNAMPADVIVVHTRNASDGLKFGEQTRTEPVCWNPFGGKGMNVDS